MPFQRLLFFYMQIWRKAQDLRKARRSSGRQTSFRTKPRPTQTGDCVFWPVYTPTQLCCVALRWWCCGRNWAKICLLVKTPRCTKRAGREVISFYVFSACSVHPRIWIGAVKKANQTPSNHGSFCGKHFGLFTDVCGSQIYLLCSKMNAGKPSRIVRIICEPRSLRLHVQRALWLFKLSSSLSNSAACSNCCMLVQTKTLSRLLR